MSDYFFDGTDNILDSRDILKKRDELIAEWEENTEDSFEDYALSADDLAVGLNRDDAEILANLIALCEEAETGVEDWEYGATLIHENYFVSYAEELADDIGAIDQNATWPLYHIDWEAAAEDLMQDYSTVELNGSTYYVR